MNLDEFCTKLPSLRLTQTQQALSILWFHDEKQVDVIMSGGQLAKIVRESGLGNPNTTILTDMLKKSGKVIASSAGFKLKVLSRAEIRDWLHPVLGAEQPEVDQELGYLPQAVWRETRGYIETVCKQMNGCYQFGFHDAASVMMRRLVETLIIEAYEFLQRESEVKDAAGNYRMLRDLVNHATGQKPIGLGRDAKDALG